MRRFEIQERYHQTNIYINANYYITTMTAESNLSLAMKVCGIIFIFAVAVSIYCSNIKINNIFIKIVLPSYKDLSKVKRSSQKQILDVFRSFTLQFLASDRSKFVLMMLC